MNQTAVNKPLQPATLGMAWPVLYLVRISSAIPTNFRLTVPFFIPLSSFFRISIRQLSTWPSEIAFEGFAGDCHEGNDKLQATSEGGFIYTAYCFDFILVFP